MQSRILPTIVAAALLWGCQSTQPVPDSGFAAVTGTWTFSHAGPSSIASPDGLDAVEVAEEQMKGGKISIREDGHASFLFAGQTNGGQSVIKDENDLAITMIGADGNENNPMIYDKSSRMLILQMVVDVDGGKGKMPLYFKRSR